MTVIEQVLPLVRGSDPDTSRTAAKRSAVNANTNRELALLALLANPQGLTDFELSEITHVQQTSIGKRRGELVAMGYVVKTSQRRPSPSGSPAIVWKAISPYQEKVS